MIGRGKDGGRDEEEGDVMERRGHKRGRKGGRGREAAFVHKR